MGTEKEEARWHWGVQVKQGQLGETIENIVFYLKLITGVMGVLLAYVVWCNVKVAHILPVYDSYMNLDEKMITRALQVNSKLNSSWQRNAWIKFIQITNAIHSRSTMPWYIKFSPRSSLTQAHMHTGFNRRVCRMVKQWFLMTMSNIYVLTIWPGRPQKQKVSCKVLTMMVQEKDGIMTSILHSTRNSMPSWRAFWLWLQWNWKWYQGSPLSPRNQEHWVGGICQCCPGTSTKIWYRLWCNCVLSGPNGHEEKLYTKFDAHCWNWESAGEA